MGGDHLVDAAGHGREVAGELLGRHEDVDVALLVLGRHAVHFRDEALEIATQCLDGVVDEGLLAGELLERRLEVTLAERLDAGHRLLLHGDVGVHHLVDAAGHGREVAGELVGRQEHVDVAPVVFGRHAVHFGDQALEVAAQGLDGLVDEGLLARELLERRLEVAFAQRLDAGHRLLLHGDMRGDHLVDAARHGRKVAAELVSGHDHVDVALVMLVRYALHFTRERRHGAGSRLQKLVRRDEDLPRLARSIRDIGAAR